MSTLPEFSFELVVRGKQAKQDLIELVIDHRHFRGDPDYIGAFRHHLGGPPNAIGGPIAAFSQLFGRPKFRDGQHVLPIRDSARGANSGLRPPLFSGLYRFSRYSSTQEAEVDVFTKLHLSLNPTRFLRHQNLEASVKTRAPAPNSRFFAHPLPEWTEEISLDDNDNWILDAPQFSELHKAQMWEKLMEAYLQGALELIDIDVERARSLENVGLHTCAQPELRPFNLKSVETYFEFRGSDPIRTVFDLHPLLESFGDLAVRAKDFEIPKWNKNSRVVTLQLRVGVTLKICAKTDKRIRFEVKHDLSEARFPKIDAPRKHTFPSLKGVVRRINELRDDAAREVNDVLTHLRNRSSIPATDKTAIDFLYDITQVLSSRQEARVIISALCHHGCVASTRELAGALKNSKRREF